MQRPPNLIDAACQATGLYSDTDISALMPSPVIILSAPRSGSTLLFEQLANQPCFWTIGGESHAVFRAFPSLRAENAALDSMALDENHADGQTCALMRRCFVYYLRNNQGTPFLALPPQNRPTSVCFLEKTPRNALNIPFLLKLFPRARFIYLHRGAKQTTSSLIEAWTLGLQTGRFVTFRDLPHWPLPAWCFLLPRGWQSMRGKTIPEVAAFQWSASNLAIIQGLSGLETRRYISLRYEHLLHDPTTALKSVLEAFTLTESDIRLPSGPLPLSRTTISPPSAEKWKRHETEIQALWPMLSQTQSKIDTFCS